MNLLVYSFKRHLKLPYYKFSNAVNPYQVLGVNTDDSISIIKKKYYKLVNKYHPDKNPSPEALKLFITVKQAFEMIKVQRGLAPKLDFVNPDNDTEGFQSSRPHAKQYSGNFDNFNQEWEGRDRKEFFSGLNRDKYENIRGSFENIEDIKGYTFSIIDKEMPDISRRLGLEKLKVSITSEKKYGTAFFSMFLVMMVIGIMARSTGRNTENIESAMSDTEFIKNVDKERINKKIGAREEVDAERVTYLRTKEMALKKLAKEEKIIDNRFEVKSISNKGN